MTDKPIIEGECVTVPDVPAEPTLGVVIFDLDKTLVDTRHRDHLVPTTDVNNLDSWRACGAESWKDSPIWDTLAMLHFLAMLNHKIVIMTGRSDEFLLMTNNYLNYLGVPYHALIMIPADYTGDYVQWKVDMLDHPEIGGKANVYCAFDDHQGIIDAFTEQGITAYKVPPYHGEAQPSPLIGKGIYDELAAEVHDGK